MRWNALFADLESQLAATRGLSADSDIAERLRADIAGLQLTDRLRSQIGRSLRFDTGAPGYFDGVLGHVGRGWVALESGPRSVLVALEHAVSVQGMDRYSAVDKPIVSLGFASALRALSRDRAIVRVFPAGRPPGSALEGSIDRVGSDFFELAAVPAGESRRAANVSGVYALTLGSTAAVTSVR